MFHVIGTVLYPDGYGVVSENLRNVPDDMPDAWPFPHPALAHTEQWFLDG
jgi:peptide/nickel transport system substrate-binding protein